MATQTESKHTDVGSYFVSNYPPFSQWKPEFVPEAAAALREEPRPDVPLGLYIHIPFCRKRCKFCYFKVYIDKNASQIEDYLAALEKEIELLGRMPALQGRKLRYVYFGGGTPSYLSEKQLARLVKGLSRHISWDHAEEVTFECEPGTLREPKLAAIRDIGVTRLSLGVENFSDEILEWNGRAHLSAEVHRAYGWARAAGFPQINVDLIAGMVGETDANWSNCVERALEMRPESLTVYQMELPPNTIISQDIREKGVESPIADWPAKRRWVDEAFGRFEENGYHPWSAYTVMTDEKPVKFIYTDALWHGADMIAIGVSSFGTFGGVHFQNSSSFEDYVGRLGRGELPHTRALRLTDGQRLIRELILQLKLGHIELDYFRRKFGADVWGEFGEAFERHAAAGMLERRNGNVELTREGLLQADALLPAFFEPAMRSVRYA